MFTRRRRVILDRLPLLAPAPALLRMAIVRDRRAAIARGRPGWVWLPVWRAVTTAPRPWHQTIGHHPGRAGKVVLPSAQFLGAPLSRIPFAIPTRPSADPQPRLRRRRGWVLRWPPANIATAQIVSYHVYANSGCGDPINYAAPIATVDGLSFTPPPLTYPGTWRFGVRAFYTSNGLEEHNLDCSVEMILDSCGNDITNRPGPPTGLRAIAIAGGSIKVEWGYPNSGSAATTPTGFHVYIGVGSLTYTSPVATVSYGSSIMNTFTAVLAGLTNGTTYTIGVRAYNGTAEEPNTITVTCVSDACGPSVVQALAATAV